MVVASSALAQVFNRSTCCCVWTNHCKLTSLPSPPVLAMWSQFLKRGGGHLQLFLELSKSSSGPKNPNKENYCCTVTLTTYFWLNLKARVFSL